MFYLNIIKGITILTLCILAVSCRDYVEKVPIQGQRVLVYTDDYRLLMNDADVQGVAFGLAPLLSSDDLDLQDAVIQTNLSSNFTQSQIYTWTKPFFVELNEDYDWNAIYKNIYTYNTIIEGVLDSKNGSVEMKNSIMGETLIHRAHAYFMLVNMYAKQYDTGTAASDPGVPLLLKPRMFGDLTRASVKSVYDQIIADVQQGIDLVPVQQPIKFMPSKAAGLALLSKIYLNMREFDKALDYANQTLAVSGTLMDYNTQVSGNALTFPSQYNDSEVILRKIPRVAYNSPQLSESLLKLFEPGDLRLKLFTRAGTNFWPAFDGLGFWPRDKYSGYPDKPAVGLTVSDIWLTKAECLARDNKWQQALEMLNQLRKLRIESAFFQEKTAVDKDETLKLIVAERRLEFFGSGLRWLDQRRLDKDTELQQTVVRTIGGKTYRLEPNSNGFVFHLANFIIEQNPEITQNPD